MTWIIEIVYNHLDFIPGCTNCLRWINQNQEGGDGFFFVLVVASRRRTCALCNISWLPCSWKLLHDNIEVRFASRRLGSEFCDILGTVIVATMFTAAICVGIPKPSVVIKLLVRVPRILLTVRILLLVARILLLVARIVLLVARILWLIPRILGRVTRARTRCDVPVPRLLIVGWLRQTVGICRGTGYTALYPHSSFKAFLQRWFWRSSRVERWHVLTEHRRWLHIHLYFIYMSYSFTFIKWSLWLAIIMGLWGYEWCVVLVQWSIRRLELPITT